MNEELTLNGQIQRFYQNVIGIQTIPIADILAMVTSSKIDCQPEVLQLFSLTMGTPPTGISISGTDVQVSTTVPFYFDIYGKVSTGSGKFELVPIKISVCDYNLKPHFLTSAP